jgi:membrane-associated protease RseP (regulator of RpoE activity)
VNRDDDQDEDDRSGAAAGPRKPRYLLHAGLFLATLLTTTMTGAIQVHGGLSIGPMRDGLVYSLPLMLILLCHELGHYVVARVHGVDASLPYFIPFPLGLGTLGAVIGMRQQTTDRKKLIDVGAAGPLAGLAVAIPVLIVGLMRSDLGPRVHEVGALMEGNSILYAVAKRLIKGAWLPSADADVNLHPMAYAGWAGLLVTMINLLPIGQLDGGHVATAFFGNRYGRFAEWLRRVLPLMAVAVFFWVLHVVRDEMGGGWSLQVGARVAMNAAVFWVVWFFLVSLMRRMSGGVNHPPVDDKPLPPSRRALFWVMVVVFVAVFMPVPMREIPRRQGGETDSATAASIEP